MFARATALTHAVILGGSVSAGWGDASSDLDFLILLDADRNADFPIPVQSSLSFQAGTIVAARQVDVEFVFASDVREFRTWLTKPDLTCESDDTANCYEIDRVANNWEMSVCHQITACHRLTNPELVDRWITDYSLYEFGAYLADLSLTLARRHVRDATRLRGGISVAENSVRMAYEQCATCALAMAGFTNPNRKWQVLLLRQLAETRNPSWDLFLEIFETLQGPIAAGAAKRAADMIDRLEAARSGKNMLAPKMGN